MNPTEFLHRYVADRRDFSWTRPDSGEVCHIVSGIWKGMVWRHDLVVVHPRVCLSTSACYLYVTGGDVNRIDLDEAQALADRSGLAVGMLFHIPNQPLFDMWEDDLIAHTFERYIDTGDAEWPLLYPMARAAIRALDVLGEITGATKFVVTGASKRGWTTWLAGATGDSRIVGIAPMVIDNLNFPMQMPHQLESWGSYSEQIEDYTSRELQGEMDSERGAELVVMMDPINYVDRIPCPILVVNGGNDRYWTVDALSLYWELLPESRRCLIVPNAGHLLGDKTQMIETVGAFGAASARGEVLPSVTAAVRREGDSIRWNVRAAGEKETRLWIARSTSLDFRDSLWESSEASPVVGVCENLAVMAEARFEDHLGPYSLSTPVQVFAMP